MTQFIEKAKNSLFSVTFSQILCGMLGAVVILLLVHLTEPQPKSVGTVNITGLVNQFVKTQAQLNLPAPVLKQRVRNFGQQLQTALDTVAAKRHVVLLVQEAVIGGARDYTKEVQAHLAELK